jgi:glycosyltransferase involved in cell wall biosynthesis
MTQNRRDIGTSIDEQQPVRVLYCIEAMLHGGTEKQLAALIRGLDRRRFEPLLCTLKPSAMDLRALRCPTIELGFRTFGSPAAAWCLARLRRFIVEHRVDVVQTFFQDPTLLGGLSSVRSGVRARIATFRDLGFWRTPAKVAQLRAVYPLFHGFLANSAAVARRVHEQDGIPLERFEVIPNGVIVCPPGERAPNPVPVVGVVANLDRPVKRVDLFLHAAKLVHQARGGVEFVIVGDGHLRSALHDQARQLGLGPSVRFVGSTTDVASHVCRFDVGVLCSDSEGLSNAILEYMACGVPSIVRDVGGNRDVVTHGENGLLVDSDHPAAIAGAIIELLSDAARRNSMARQARATAARFSPDACIRRHEQYYERLLDRPRAVPHRLFQWSLR